jgi:hypothetical protein
MLDSTHARVRAADVVVSGCVTQDAPSISSRYDCCAKRGWDPRLSKARQPPVQTQAGG